MMAQSRTESTRDTYNYGQYINQFPPNMIKVIREFERILKKICRHKMSIMFNEICIYIYIYIYIYRERERERDLGKSVKTAWLDDDDDDDVHFIYFFVIYIYILAHK